MQSATEILRLIDHLYGSVLDDSLWTKSLSSLGRYMNGDGTFYIASDPSTETVIEAAGVDADPAIQAAYLRDYAKLDVQLPPALTVPVGAFMTEYSLLAPGVFEASEIGSFCEHWNIPHRLIMWIGKSPRMVAAISIQRSKQRGRFLEDDFARYRPVVPHLLRAFRTRELLRSLRRSSQLYFEAFDRLPFGVAFLNESGQVMETTQHLNRLLRAGQSIGIRRQRIFALHPADDRRLQAAIGCTLRFPEEGSLPGGTITVKRSNGGRPLTVVVIPGRWQSLSAPIAPHCMLVVFDPEASPQPALSTLKTTFGMTEAEALLAATLLTGITLREAADKLRLSINTCKSQLKSIYAKTECSSHVELAKQLLKIGIAQNFDFTA